VNGIGAGSSLVPRSSQREFEMFARVRDLMVVDIPRREVLKISAGVRGTLGGE